MRIISEAALAAVLGALRRTPRPVQLGIGAVPDATRTSRLPQAEQIISRIAHPLARDELREAGRALGFGL